MNTVEDFRNAPAGATATLGDGTRVMKMDEADRYWMVDRSWLSQNGVYFSDVTMEFWGFTLDRPTPTTAREALELAWDLAHEVKEGQVIPKGTQYLEFNGYGLRQSTASREMKVSPGLAPLCRTLEPLPDPEPDWQEAPAVLAATSRCPDRKVWVPQIYNPEYGGVWKCSCCQDEVHWYELVDVTPLYPNEKETK